MDASEVDGLTQSKPIEMEYVHALTFATGTAHLNVDDAQELQEPLFPDYRAEAPPAPKLNSPGIVAKDITAAFTSAAASMFLPEANVEYCSLLMACST